MVPQLAHIGPIPINSFGLMIALAFLAGIHRLTISLVRNGLDPSIAERYILTGAVSGVLGARVWYLLAHWSEMVGGFFDKVFSSAGFTFYGGFIVAAAAIAFRLVRDGIPFAAFVDSLGPTLALGYAIGRVGCQLSGDGDYGSETASIFGMSYSQGVVPTAPGVLVWPTPIFESMTALGIAFLLNALEQRSYFTAPFRKFGTYLFLISLERLLVEFIRIERRVGFGFTEAQFVALALMTLGVFLLLRPVGMVRQSSQS